jgi:uncharacterized protein (TIRG00374 family)
MKQKIKNISVAFIKILIAITLIYWLISSGKIDFSVTRFLLNPWLAFFALGLTFLNLFCASERWRLLLKSQNILNTRLKTFQLSSIGLLFNFVMPGGVGGDVIKVFYAIKDSSDKKIEALNTVLLDRVIGLYTMILFGFASMLLDLKILQTSLKLHSIFLFLLALTFISSLGLFLLFNQNQKVKETLLKYLKFLPHHQKFQKLYLNLNLYGKNLKVIAQCICLSFFAQLAAILLMVGIGTQLGYQIPLTTYFIAIPLGFIITAIPISPGGVGVGQAAFLYLFNLFTQQETPIGPTLVTSLQILQFVFGLYGAYIFVRMKKQKTFEQLQGA